MTAEPIGDTYEYADAEGMIRDALRDSPRLALVGRRVFFGHPEAVSYPYVTVSRIGGGPRGAVDSARLSAQAWGSTKKSAADVAKSVAAAVDGMGGMVEMILWQPAPPDGDPRYIIDFTLDIVATPVAAE